MEMNEVLKKLPQHLMSLVIEQPYNDYTARDHAVWRYVMRQNVKFLSGVAHGSYTEGLKKTGISIDSIPHMYGMNRILKEIGWAAVAVDGFIPPSAFMEFQAYNVLVIAADIRPANQIEYTPAPDIIHEAAGHAPIIADKEYSAYLKLFGEIGSKAFSSARDYELYEAVRHLSILKADPNTPEEEIKKAEEHLAYIDSSMGEPSEMARIRNLHWWTVEYGLIGSIESPRIYGAGLLSSIGESYNCMQPHVKKLPYSIAAADYNFDITTQQPQLFVTPDFRHLSDVLNKFADTMALRTGGAQAVKKAEGSGAVATVVLDSGMQITGVFSNCIYDGDTPVYLKTTGNSSLAYNNKEIPGHGKSYHKNGFGTPVGKYELTFEDGAFCELTFKSGVVIRGRLTGTRQVDGKKLIHSFHECTVTYKDEVLFEPSWGKFDMAVGTKVISAFPGPADPGAFKLTYKAPAETTHKIVYSEADKKLHTLYKEVRDIRESDRLTTEASAKKLYNIWHDVKEYYHDEWLIMLELLELANCNANTNGLAEELKEHLEKLKAENESLQKLIDDGIALAGNITVTANTTT